MPIANSGKVLATGANGYIAIWVVKALLEQGYSVRGTVRSESKGTHLKERFKSYGDKLEVVVVEDITKEGAFDEAVKGVDVVEHMASPFHFNAEDPNELITPAVAGTSGVLQSALLHGKDVKRIVVLASTAAILETNRSAPVVFTEDDWNNHAIQQVETKGKDASPADKYQASKTLAEKAAWAFYEQHKNEVKWDLVVLNPPFVFGPVLHAVDSPESLNTSAKEWYYNVVKGRLDQEALANSGKEEASGNRIIISAGAFKWQDWVNASRLVAPELPPGNTSYKREKAVHQRSYDNSKAAKLLQLPYRTLEATAADCIADFKQKGWL
ncbi:unnamed protein product [Somion occarium]|uniref:NAD-dependent epimerase/dehydratase domain-containing protein n=1 Tax=Somion occarium TaxID=3059160 RepID=A0ABP1DND4_9APHY